MDDKTAEDLIRKLRKRGFATDAAREYCELCTERAQAIFKLSSRLGGRDIKWCFACGSIRTWRRSADDKLTEELNFDLVKFLE